MIEIDEEKNPLWKPGTYPHDSKQTLRIEAGQRVVVRVARAEELVKSR